jgi:cytochrome c-type biogenesis protein CcmH/NrfG
MRYISAKNNVLTGFGLSLTRPEIWVGISVIAGLLLVLPGPAQETGQSFAARAARQIQAGDFQAARSLLQQAVRDHPSDVELWNLFGITETELHDERSAKNAFEQGLRLAPDSVSLHENIGLLYYRNADYVTARNYLEYAVKLGSKKPGVLFSLAASELRTGNQREALSRLRELEPALAGKVEYWEERGRAELALDPAASERSLLGPWTLRPKTSRL